MDNRECLRELVRKVVGSCVPTFQDNFKTALRFHRGTGDFSMAKWFKDGRPEEKIGGGYFVFRRHRGSQRIAPAKLPFEYSTIEAASAQADKLAYMFPGQKFDILQVVETHIVPAIEAVDRVVELA